MKLKLRNLVGAIALLALTTSTFAAQPKVGDKALEFTLRRLEDKDVKLGELTAKEQAVLVVLRGWSGYQCPLCTSRCGS